MPLPKPARMLFAALAATTALGAAVPAVSRASAEGCTGGGIHDCIDVHGDGYYVERATVKFGVGPRIATAGYYVLTYPSGDKRYSPEFSYHNESWWHSQEWSYTWAFNHNFHGGQMCGQFISYKYETHRACITIHG